MKKLLLISFTIFICAGTITAQNSIITGITRYGGGNGSGTAYTYNPSNGSDSLLFSFAGNGNNVFLGKPEGNLIQANNGKLYGMATLGGNWNYGGIFCYDTVTKTANICISFDSNMYPFGAMCYGSLVQATNGLLYGMTDFGGQYGYGVIFCYSTVTGKDSIVHSFNGTDGKYPSGSLMQASNGLLYGSTTIGGGQGSGVVFSFDPVTGKDSILFNLNDSTGYGWAGALMQASNGLIYGAMPDGGRHSMGTVFYYNPATGNDSVLFSFNGSDGANPEGKLMQASNGLLYGMTFYGGSYADGVIFYYNILSGNDSAVFSYTHDNYIQSQSSLIQANNGLLYGMLSFDGTYDGYGEIFSFNPLTSHDSVVAYFYGQPNGSYIEGDLVQAADGYLYGLTTAGGPQNGGVIFILNTATNLDTVLANFEINPSLSVDDNSPILASNGLYYGMTYQGGIYNAGTLFSYNPLTGQDTVLENFDDVTIGYPDAPLIKASNGLLYGMAPGGSIYSEGGGVIFSFNPATGNDSVVFNFDSLSGEFPFASLVQAPNGLLYGTCEGWGAANSGTLFSFDPVSGKDSVLFAFNDTMGSTPLSTLSIVNNVLYGTTSGGGATGNGVLFTYNINTGQYDTIESIYTSDLGGASGSTIVDTSLHTIYWVTPWNSNNPSSNGALGSYNMITKQEDSVIFNYYNGSTPTGLLVWDTAANFIYGTNSYGGTHNYGTLFRYNVVTKQDTTLYNFHDSITPVARTMNYSNAALGAYPCGIVLNKNNSIITKTNSINNKKETISVYPNPVSSNTMVMFSSSDKHYLELDDITGRKISSAECTGQQYELNCEGLSPGVYFITTHTEGQTSPATAKIVIE
jgi:uncharacterized repeat protein (TIGR03803 family)